MVHFTVVTMASYEREEIKGFCSHSLIKHKLHRFCFLAFEFRIFKDIYSCIALLSIGLQTETNGVYMHQQNITFHRTKIPQFYPVEGRGTLEQF